MMKITLAADEWSKYLEIREYDYKDKDKAGNISDEEEQEFFRSEYLKRTDNIRTKGKPKKTGKEDEDELELRSNRNEMNGIRKKTDMISNELGLRSTPIEPGFMYNDRKSEKADDSMKEFLNKVRDLDNDPDIERCEGTFLILRNPKYASDKNCSNALIRRPMFYEELCQIQKKKEDMYKCLFPPAQIHPEFLPPQETEDEISLPSLYPELIKEAEQQIDQ
jgi:hypothetical protein